jgi:hypothetical protein
MKVICDNCRAVYKIPDEKLVKPVNKATCRQCGHRMLIPRPRLDADPDERTLVTAVPPTPPPAPARQAISEDPPTNPIGENPERTAPKVRRKKSGEVALHTATPAPVRRAEKKKPAKPARSTGQVTQPPRVPPTSSAHDPAGDMSWVFLGALGALCGSLLLALIPLISPILPNVALLTPLLTSLGLIIALGGALTGLLVMLTGARGRKPAKTMLSVLLGGFLAIVVGILPLAIPLIANTVNGMSQQTAAVVTTPPDQLKPDAKAENTAGAQDSADATAEVENVEAATTSSEKEDKAPDTSKAEKTTASKSESRRSSSSSRSRSGTDSSASSTSPPAREVEKPKREEVEDELDLPDDILAPEPKEKERSSSSSSKVNAELPDKPPVAAIDMMLKSNINVKKCFHKYQVKHGKLPARVDVKFTISPEGKSSRAGVKQSEYAATDLDFCLSAAIKGITFPPSQKGFSGTFPFIMQ